MSKFTGAMTTIDGTRRWYVNGNYHRLDGPAIEGADGYRGWYVDGERHRLDGPAVEKADGERWWYVDGKMHVYWRGMPIVVFKACAHVCAPEYYDHLFSSCGVET
jgi:hypothetical protein